MLHETESGEGDQAEEASLCAIHRWQCFRTLTVVRPLLTRDTVTSTETLFGSSVLVVAWTRNSPLLPDVGGSRYTRRTLGFSGYPSPASKCPKGWADTMGRG
jgi:hypothetical protein